MVEKFRRCIKYCLIVSGHRQNTYDIIKIHMSRICQRLQELSDSFDYIFEPFFLNQASKALYFF